MKVSTITLGCKVNQYETQAMLNQLLQGGFSACQTGEDADIILLNSCTVTSTSDHKVKQTLHKARREHPHAVIVLTGCMPQAFPELAEDLTDADIVLGNSNRSSLLPHILQYLSTRQRIIDIVPHQTKEKFESMSVENFMNVPVLLLKFKTDAIAFALTALFLMQEEEYAQNHWTI